MAASESDPSQVLKAFQSIPGVGKSIAGDLYNLGYRSLQDVKIANPEDMLKSLAFIRVSTLIVVYSMSSVVRIIILTMIPIVNC